MQELSLHILDIARNSFKADASFVEIALVEDLKRDVFSIKISDNGVGMNEDTLNKVSNPFFTSRKTRKVGLGIPLFKMAAEFTGGNFNIMSNLNEGTITEASFVHSSVDRMPLGDIIGTITTLITNEYDVDIYFIHRINNEEVTFDTREVKRVLDGVSILEPSIVLWCQNNLEEQYLKINKTEVTK